MRHHTLRLVIALVALLGWSTAFATASRAEERPFVAQHRAATFSFLHEGEVSSQRTWPDVFSPRKFTMEVTIEQSGAQIILMVFDLVDKSGEWWLSEVMGFLFDPNLVISSDVTAQGYEAYEIKMPGGRGVFEQTEVLLVAERTAFRFVCYRCEDAGVLDSFHKLIDSFESRCDRPEESLGETK